MAYHYKRYWIQHHDTIYHSGGGFAVRTLEEVKQEMKIMNRAPNVVDSVYDRKTEKYIYKRGK